MKYQKIDFTFKDFDNALIQLITNKNSVLSWGGNTPDKASISFSNGKFHVHQRSIHPHSLAATNYNYFCNHPEELTLWILPEWYEKASWENPIPVFVSNENEDPGITNSSIRFLIGVSDDGSMGKFKCCHSAPRPRASSVTFFKYANPVREEDK